MIRNVNSKSVFYISLVVVLIAHAAILSFLKYDTINLNLMEELSNDTKTLKKSMKLNNIEVLTPEEVDKIRKVGVKNGKADLNRPDLAFKPPPPPKAKPSPETKGPPGQLSMDKLAPELPASPLKKPSDNKASSASNPMARDFLKPSNDKGGHFYFDYKDKKVIPRSQDQEQLKAEAVRSYNVPVNKATDKISNFEIRYERPEGVSEDELNSDEKAYYSFYVRSYQNYYSKIYATYEKMVIERPALSKVFDKKHVLIGKIDYDEAGNIVTVKILKSSEDDDLHAFFEETLKQLNQPNPPRVFVKNRKQFSIYYQLQIN